MGLRGYKYGKVLVSVRFRVRVKVRVQVIVGDFGSDLRCSKQIF